MWKLAQDVLDGVEPKHNKFYDKPSHRRRWDAIFDPKILPSHLEYSPPRSSWWNASRQVLSEQTKLQRSGVCVEYNRSSSLRSVGWDVSTQVPPKPKLRTSSLVEYAHPSRPARIAGGNGCNCCPCLSVEKLVESCLPGLHQKYVDCYDSKVCIEGHLPAAYRSFVEHDDLYLPPSRALSPASTDHDDLYLPLKTSDHSPRECCPCDLRKCDSDPIYGNIYLPPSRPCTPAFPMESCSGYRAPCNPPPCYPCPPLPCYFCPPPPCYPCPPPPQETSCGPKIVCSCPPYIKKLAPCSAPPCPPPNCSCPLYIKKLSPSPPSSPPTSCRPSPCCRPARQCSTVYIDEVPSPPAGNRYIACQECLCHKDLSTRSLCPLPKKLSPCRDCVCHLGARSPSQGGAGCPPKGAHTRCQAGFQTPGKGRLKLHLNQSQCLECKSPYSCKGPPNCNPQYIVETPLSPNTFRSRSSSPCVRRRSPTSCARPRSPGSSGKCDSPIVSSRCQTCDCNASGGGSSSYKNSCGPPNVNPKLFEDPCCPPCIPVPPCRPVSPCRPLLAAEMLSELEACVIRTKACGGNPASCTDSQCASYDCHKPRCPPSPPPCRPAPPSPPSPPCSTPPLTSCSRPPPPSCSPCRPAPPSCSSFDDVHNPVFNNFQSTSPRCKDCDCHKPKNCKFSTQICKFCRGAGWCYCEYHTTKQLLTSCSDSERQSTYDKDHTDMEVKERVITQVSGESPGYMYQLAQNTYQSADNDLLAKSSKVQESPHNEGFEPTIRPPESDQPLQSEATSQLCCCGKCKKTKPRFAMKTKCPFCDHVHSCCCGMCSCPMPNCSSKTPLAFDGPMPHLSLNSSGALTGRNNSLLYSHRLKLEYQLPKQKLGFASPDKSTPKPFSSLKPQHSRARVMYSSQKTQGN